MRRGEECECGERGSVSVGMTSRKRRGGVWGVWRRGGGGREEPMERR